MHSSVRRPSNASVPYFRTFSQRGPECLRENGRDAIPAGQPVLGEKWCMVSWYLLPIH
jgi:hypothetical protein